MELPENDSFVRILIVEDDDLCFLLNKTVIEKENDLKIVGHAKTKESAIQLASELKPDVILLDINLTNKEDQYGIDVAIELSISMTEVKIIMLSGLLNKDTVRSTMGLGVASNYLLKTDPEKLPNAIREVVKGKPQLEGSVIDFIMKDYRDSLKATMMKLNSHHIKVLELFYRGYSVEEVSDILKMEIQSVRNLQQAIGKKCLGWKWRFRNLSTIEIAKRAKKLELF
jgi:DNA-binding NarL/FixJ family response regulator